MPTVVSLPKICIFCRLRGFGTVGGGVLASRFGHGGLRLRNVDLLKRTFASVSSKRDAVRSSPGSSSSPYAVKELLDQLERLDIASKSFGLSDTTVAEAWMQDGPSNVDNAESLSHIISPEAIVRQAREAFGDVLPEDYLNAEEYKIYERLYGSPIKIPFDSDTNQVDFENAEIQGELDEEAPVGTGLLKENEHGELEEIQYLPDEDVMDEEMDMDEDEMEELEEMSAQEYEEMSARELAKLEKTKKGRFFVKATKVQLDTAILDPSLPKAEEAAMNDIDAEWDGLDAAGHTMYLYDVRYMKLETFLRRQNKGDEADELLRMLFIRYRSQEKKELAVNEDAETLPLSQTAPNAPQDILEEECQEEGSSGGYERAHPLTMENRFGTLPATIQLPKSSMVDPIGAIISGTVAKHLTESAQKIFGGAGLPYSTSNPGFAKVMQQKPIPLEASQGKMSEVEADAFFAAIVPGVFASVTSIMVETRKRLGSSWLESLLSKEGGPRILDAGGAGAGILAVREVLRAEWERMNDNSDDPESPTEIAMAGGETGGAPIAAPTGKATVLTSNDPLRRRASLLLDNTAFIPRLPDYIHASDESARDQGKFDIVIAPHTLWPLKEEYLRKQHVSNLWSLVSANGGVLILLEKGVPRGFEAIGGARDFLLNKRLASPGYEHKSAEVEEPDIISADGVIEKEKGMIIAPCTNHTTCPMYSKGGLSKGRKDFCHFEQRYIRPPYLQKILGAKDKNFEDVKFSYLSVLRGRDLRDADEFDFVQDDRATDRAFVGYEHEQSEQKFQSTHFDPTAPAVPDLEDQRGPHSLSLPRAVMPPLKRTGHVIIDLCTPSGTLERWTVPKSFSRQAFRDARKSSWGDLWALGAKTRVARNVRLGGNQEERGGVDNPHLTKATGKKRAESAKKRKTKAKNIIEVGYDSEGRIKEEDVKLRTYGRLRQGRIPGIRDKRDKTGTGRGRRKALDNE